MKNLRPEDFQPDEDVTAEFEEPAARIGRGVVVSARLEPADARRLLERAAADDRTVSGVVVEALRSYLSGLD